MKAVVDQLTRMGKRELICLLLFICNYVVSVRRGFLFLWVLRMGYVILLWHSLSLPYNYSTKICVCWRHNVDSRCAEYRIAIFDIKDLLLKLQFSEKSEIYYRLKIIF